LRVAQILGREEIVPDEPYVFFDESKEKPERLRWPAGVLMAATKTFVSSRTGGGDSGTVGPRC